MQAHQKDLTPQDPSQSLFNNLRDIQNITDDTGDLAIGHPYNQDLTQLQKEDHDLKRNYFINNFFNQTLSESNPSNEIEREWHAKIAVLEGAKGEPLSEADKAYLQACGLNKFIRNFAIQNGAEHFLMLKTGGPIAYLIYCAHQLTDHQIRDAAVVNLSHQFGVSIADVQETLLMLTAMKDLVTDKKKLPQDVYQIVQAFKNRIKVPSKTPANQNLFAINDNKNILPQPKEKIFAGEQKRLFTQGNQPSPSGPKALDKNRPKDTADAKPSPNKGAANPAEGVQPGANNQKDIKKPHVGAHQPIPAPKKLEAFPNAQRVKPKAFVQGGGSARKRWEDKKYIYEWDSQHGTVEKYNKRGKHLGEFNPKTREQLKPADPTRSTPI